MMAKIIPVETPNRSERLARLYSPTTSQRLRHYFAIASQLLRHYFASASPLLRHYFAIALPLLRHCLAITPPSLPHYTGLPGTEASGGNGAIRGQLEAMVRVGPTTYTSAIGGPPTQTEKTPYPPLKTLIQIPPLI